MKADSVTLGESDAVMWEKVYARASASSARVSMVLEVVCDGLEQGGSIVLQVEGDGTEGGVEDETVDALDCEPLIPVSSASSRSATVFSKSSSAIVFPTSSSS